MTASVPTSTPGEFLEAVLRCPRCVSDLSFDGTQYNCTAMDCPYGPEGTPFPTSEGQPVLIDFDASIFSRSDYLTCPAPSPPGGAAPGSSGWRRAKRLVRRLLRGENAAAQAACSRFLGELKARDDRPTVLVVGGGTIGSGCGALYQDHEVTLIGTDVFASEATALICDGHQLPFVDESFSGVWIQAVLEHVLDPSQVVAEIHRILKPGGIVYAGTPFMQQVHMGAFDFTRFTLSGHRWLFRNFEQIDAGVAGGAGLSTIWSIRYLARALGAGPNLAGAVAAPFFWLRFLDRFAKPTASADAASGVYFLGRKSGVALSPKDMPAYYETGNGVR